jgi:hypothetical protein
MMESLPPLTTLAVIMAIFLLAGTVKGSFGIGFPAVAMSILPMVIDSALAVTLLAIPIVVTNARQMMSVKDWRKLVQRYWLAGLSLAITIFFVSQLLDDVNSRWINIFVALSLIVFALSAMFKIELPVSEALGWQLLVGITSGLIGGVSAVKSPVMIYTVALKLPRDTFITVAGFLFFCGGAGMLTGVTTASLMSVSTATVSVLALFAALLGFQVGERVRKRLNAVLFRNLVLWLLLALGLRLLAVNAF